MRWLRRLRSKPRAQTPDEALRSAREQLKDAEHDLAAARERTSEIAEIARTLRTLREQNHFAPLVLRAFGGSKQ